MSEYDTTGNKGLRDLGAAITASSQQIREAVAAQMERRKENPDEFVDGDLPDEVAVEALGFESAPESLGRLMGIASVVLTGFARKHLEYGGKNHEDLGARAQFIDINRKTLKLRAALWDGADTSLWAEQPIEIAGDLIGHCLLLIDLLQGGSHD